MHCTSYGSIPLKNPSTSDYMGHITIPMVFVQKKQLVLNSLYKRTTVLNIGLKNNRCLKLSQKTNPFS